MAVHRGLIVVDSTLPVDVLDTELVAGWRVRDELHTRMARAMVEAIASLPARVVDVGETSPAADLVGAW